MQTLSLNWWFWVPTIIGFAIAFAFYLTSQFQSKEKAYIPLHKFHGIVPKITLGTGFFGTTGSVVFKLFGVAPQSSEATSGLILSVLVLSFLAFIISVFVQVTVDSKRTLHDGRDVIEVEKNHLLGFNGAAFSLAVCSIIIVFIAVLQIAAIYTET